MKPRVGCRAYHPHNGDEAAIVNDVDEQKNLMRVKRNNNKLSAWITTQGWSFETGLKDTDEGLHEE